MLSDVLFCRIWKLNSTKLVSILMSLKAPLVNNREDREELTEDAEKRMVHFKLHFTNSKALCWA